MIGECLLELQVGRTSLQFLGKHLKGNVGINDRHYMAELRIGNETIEHFRKLFGLKRPYAVKNFRNFHTVTIK